MGKIRIWRERVLDEVFADLPELMTVQQVVKILGIPERTLWRRISGGEIVATHIGRSVRVVKDSLLEYLQERNFLNWEEVQKIKAKRKLKRNAELSKGNKKS